ncbi:MAG TPA: GNAT family N-acetyltransferase [Ktedonobacterales bacterium]
MSQIALQEITADTWRQCARLKVRSDQENFVAPNVSSLAQSKYEPGLLPLAVYDGETMVGFVMYNEQPYEPGKYFIYRVMVGAEFQSKGYGRAAMRALIERMKALPNCQEIVLSYEPENTVAERLYESLGFRKTGEIFEGEVVSSLKLT